jgi:hypothetical protein
MRRTSIWMGALTLLLAATGKAQAGPISALYLGSGSQIHVVQGSSIVNSWAAPGNNEHAIAVDSTVRTVGYFQGAVGREYTLTGTTTGTTYTNPLPNSGIYDGTTDGTFNYAVNYNDGVVYRFNSDWTTAVALFDAGTNTNFVGITYDSTNNSLWISGWGDTMVHNYTMDGTLLSSFSTGHITNGALALDSADGTLWLRNFQTTGQFEQYSKTGTLLSTQDFALANTFGGEFAFTGGAQAVPEPASLTMLGIGAFGTIGFAWRRRKNKPAKDGPETT